MRIAGPSPGGFCSGDADCPGFRYRPQLLDQSHKVGVAVPIGKRLHRYLMSFFCCLSGETLDQICLSLLKVRKPSSRHRVPQLLASLFCDQLAKRHPRVEVVLPCALQHDGRDFMRPVIEVICIAEEVFLYQFGSN